MPNFNNWLGATPYLSTWLDDVDRGVDTAMHIADKPTSIVINRKGVDLAAQTVRLEPAGSSRDQSTENARVSNAGVYIFGYKGHPTITDTDIKKADRFRNNGKDYEVKDVLPDTPDRLIAIAEASP